MYPFFTAIFLILIAGTQLFAQIPNLASKLGPVASPAEKVDDTDARLQTWLKEARLALTTASEAGGETRLPVGILPSAFSDYRRDLEQLVSAIRQVEKNQLALVEARKATEAARLLAQTWVAFPAGPPYSFLMVDELLNQREAVRGKMISYRSSEDLINRRIASVQDEVKKRQQNSPSEPSVPSAADEVATAWRENADRVQSRVIALRGALLQGELKRVQEQSEIAKHQLALLDRQLAMAEKRTTFSDDDLEKIKIATAGRQEALRKELAQNEKNQQSAIAQRAKIQAMVDAQVKPDPPATPTDGLLTLKLEATEIRVLSLQSISDDLEFLILLESQGLDLYQKRKALMDSSTSKKTAADIDYFQSSYERLASRESVILNALATISADLRNQETKLTTLTAEDPRFTPTQEIRTFLSNKQTSTQRVQQALSSQKQLLQRWLDGYAPTPNRSAISQKLLSVSNSASEFFRQVAQFEVFPYDVTTFIDGVPLTLHKAVTLYQLIIALFCFTFSYYLVNRVKNHFRDIVVSRGHIADAQARTLSNWLMIFVGLVLLIATLSFLKIPLTVFAFFGGALAIGIGFGAQTLIKNFISGIIMLFERTIRVGDVVDVGGITGSIVEINTRSSVLRGVDGKETLIPNSLFLESKITNLTLSNRLVRRVINLPVSLDSSPAEVSEILEEVIIRHNLVLKIPAPIVAFEDITSDAFIFAVYYWVELSGKASVATVSSDLRFMIEKRLTEAGVHFTRKNPSNE